MGFARENRGVEQSVIRGTCIFTNSRDIKLNAFQIFILRALLGGIFAVIISRFFYPQANLIYVAGLGVILVGLAYFAEYLRMRRTNKK